MAGIAARQAHIALQQVAALCRTPLERQP
jgi:hypothetical protein